MKVVVALKYIAGGGERPFGEQLHFVGLEIFTTPEAAELYADEWKAETHRDGKLNRRVCRTYTKEVDDARYTQPRH